MAPLPPNPTPLPRSCFGPYFRAGCNKDGVRPGLQYYGKWPKAATARDRTDKYSRVAGYILSMAAWHMQAQQRPVGRLLGYPNHRLRA